jgi:hypothetical protein
LASLYLADASSESEAIWKTPFKLAVTTAV